MNNQQFNFIMPDVAYNIASAIQAMRSRLSSFSLEYNLTSFAVTVSPDAGLPAGACQVLDVPGTIALDNTVQGNQLKDLKLQVEIVNN